MNEQEALSRMVSPGMPRNGIWRKGVLQIIICRSCDRACAHCTQGSGFLGKSNQMSLDHFAKACDSLKGYFGVVGVFAGNPATHKQFDEICEIMRDKIPYEQRGIWCNNPLGKGKTMRATFRPDISNLNVHLDMDAYNEFARDWPECAVYLKGHDKDSRHGPPFVAMADLGLSQEEIWDKAASCDVNQRWSAAITTVRGELRGFFCELAAAQAVLHADNPDWAGTGKPMPDTGVSVVPDWWKQGMDAFAEQARQHCRMCGIPLKGFGQLAVGGDREQYSKSHEFIMRPKLKDRLLELITDREQLKEGALGKATNYMENSSLPIIQ
ncbi:MAG: hypothetical protein EBW87_02260 [Burkholderiaceae bacterium]|nr:hypothetical protein [Burkholderiaceae bacterium]